MKEYNMGALLEQIAPGCIIVETDGLTEGAACSILLAKQYINNSEHLILANSDQLMNWEPNSFLNRMHDEGVDGGIVTFQNDDPKWSYAKVDLDGLVSEVAEKNPISNNATTGIYFWKKGSDFVKYADDMISKDIRVNNEFYTCPVFNEAIQDAKKVKIFQIDEMFGLGVPEDLEYFLTVSMEV